MAADYTITEQRPVIDATAGGTYAPAMEIRFTTRPTGTPGVVRVPQAQYTADHVNEVVTAAAQAIEAVNAL